MAKEELSHLGMVEILAMVILGVVYGSLRHDMGLMMESELTNQFI